MRRWGRARVREPDWGGDGWEGACVERAERDVERLQVYPRGSGPGRDPGRRRGVERGYREGVSSD